MRRVIAFLVVAGVAVALAWWLAGLPGTVAFTAGRLSITAPTSLAILAAIVLFLVLYLLVRLLAFLMRLPSRTRRMRRERVRASGERAVTRTLLALAGGDSAAARTEARRTRELLGDTPQTLLLAAYAGRQAGQQEEADAAFNLLAARKDAAFLGLRGLLQGAVAGGDWDRAHALARRAEEIAPGTPWLRAERGRLAIRAGSWHEALELAGPGDPVAALSVAAANSATDAGEARRLAKRAWKADPGFAPAALAYASRLRDAGKESRAQEVLRLGWAKSPHPDLADAALAGGTYTVSRERRADALAAAAPDHPESHLLLARSNLAAGQLPDARRHAEAALAAGMNQRRVWLVLAQVAEQQDDRPMADESLRKAAEAEPDPVWRCENCGTVQDGWRPVCETCHTAGRITWGSTMTRQTPLLLADMGDAILP